jgi:small conductance mechanosensitive channel
MNVIKNLRDALPDLAITLAIITAVIFALWAAHWILLSKNRKLGEEQRSPRRIAMGVIVLLGCMLILLAIPIDDGVRSQLIGLLGLLLSVAIALASTTFVSNAMAGFMLRAVRSFRPGDFIQIGEQFGRVTERGLFHVEIQTEDRDLTTLPNLYLVSHPVKVIRYSGTVVSATVSLGYDIPYQQVVSLLIEAATNADLQNPFVQVTDLGDFSVTYRTAGILTEVKQLLTARSNLRAKILTTLHSAGVEIVSPNFMTQRQLREQERVLPPDASSPSIDELDPVPEERIFDKAEQAEELERLHLERRGIEEKIKHLGEQLKKASGDDRSVLERDIDRLKQRCDEITDVFKSGRNEEQDPS